MTHNGLENVLAGMVGYANASKSFMDKIFNREYKLMQEGNAYFICDKTSRYLKVEIKNNTLITNRLIETKPIIIINRLLLEYAEKCNLEPVEI